MEEKNRNKSQTKKRYGSAVKKQKTKDQSEQVKDLYYELNPEEKHIKKKVDFDLTLNKFQNFLENKN